MAQCNLSGENITFPDPAYIGNVEWQIRYGNPTREQLLVAASALANLPRHAHGGVVAREAQPNAPGDEGGEGGVMKHEYLVTCRKRYGWPISPKKGEVCLSSWRFRQIYQTEAGARRQVAALEGYERDGIEHPPLIEVFSREVGEWKAGGLES